jgi:probable phosphoglycerate mutase
MGVQRVSAAPRVYSWQELRRRLAGDVLIDPAIELHLTRHAETEANAGNRISGSRDVHLSLHGEHQARQLGHCLDSHYNVAYVSTLSRTLRTLELAIEEAGVSVDRTVRDRRLNERSLGVLEGSNARFIPEYADGDIYYAPQGGESYFQVARRILSFLLDVSTEFNGHDTKIIVCGHMGPMRILIGIVDDFNDPASVLGLRFSNAQVVKLDWKLLRIPRFIQDARLEEA